MNGPLPLVVVVLCLLLTMNTIAQETIDFTESVDPASLELTDFYEHMDTSRIFRLPIALEQMKNEFPLHRIVDIETYYRKSPQHLLLKLGTGPLPLERTFAFSEGRGSTYFRLYDDNCAVVIEVTANEGVALEPRIRDRNCNY